MLCDLFLGEKWLNNTIITQFDIINAFSIIFFVAKTAKKVSIQVFILSALSNSLWTAYGVMPSKPTIIVTKEYG